MTSRKLARDVTHTAKVIEALREVDDFLPISSLTVRTGLKMNQVSAALHNLRRHKAVDVVVDPDGRGWWFARPKEDDTRIRALTEIVQGIKRNRKKRK